MKKIVIILLFLVIILPRARSQDDDIQLITGGGGSGQFLYGAKIGLVSSTFASQGQKLEDCESRTGVAAGIFGEYKFNASVGVTVEALYVQEGTMRLDPSYLYYYTTYPGNNFSLTKENSNVLLNNIEVPVLVNYYLPEMGGIKLKAFAGPSFDFIMQAKAKNLLSVQWYGQQGESIVLDERASDIVSTSFNTYYFSAVIGAGVTYDKYTLDISFKWGVTPINSLATYNINNYNGREDISTNTLMIKLGVNINEFMK